METKLLMKLVVATEALFFLALLMAFVYFSLGPGFRAQQLAALDWRSTGAFTLLLFASSFTYWRAEASYRQGAPGRQQGFAQAGFFLWRNGWPCSRIACYSRVAIHITIKLRLRVVH